MEYRPQEFEPIQEPNIYRTGDTRPPKNHSGLIAVLLVAVILLCGAVSVLGVANIRLVRRYGNTEQADVLPIVHSDAHAGELTDATTPSVAGENRQDAPIVMQPSELSKENMPQADGLSLQEIYEKTIQSVVSISASYGAGSSTGTGVILTEDGYIVTNCHVVENAKSEEVLLTDGRRFSAELVGQDEVSDLAVLQITAENLTPVALGDSSVLRVGDSVVAIGDPLGVELRGSMTDGIVSAINRDINIEGRTMSLIQTNAALNSGNSGGPLINCYGQVVGINTMKMGDSMSVAGVEGLGFAIPSITVRDVVNQLIRQGYVSGRPYLGITGESVSVFYQIYYGIPAGLYVTQVEDGSTAAAAGISRGDVVLSIEGARIADYDSLRSRLYNYQPGDNVELIVYRSGRQYAITLTIEEANS